MSKSRLSLQIELEVYLMPVHPDKTEKSTGKSIFGTDLFQISNMPPAPSDSEVTEFDQFHGSDSIQLANMGSTFTTQYDQFKMIQFSDFFSNKSLEILYFRCLVFPAIL